MILSDRDIERAIKEKRIVIKPFDGRCVQPSTYDLHLLGEVLVFDNYTVSEIDVRSRVDVSRRVKISKDGFVLHPREFILGSTREWFKIPADICAKLEGKSSLGRLGLIIHATAGYIDPGFEGQLTFEISNISRVPIRMYAGMEIGQICFLKMSGPAKNLYGSKKLRSKYQGQTGPTASRVYPGYGRKTRRK